MLDVARAADPAAAAEAREKLQRIAAGARPGVSAAEGAGARFEVPPAPSPVTAPHALAKGAPPKAYVQFEGMVLQTFLQSMMPDDADSVYGGGLSGDMWKSMLARTIAETMAERGGIGIASRMLKDNYVEGGKLVPVRGVTDEAEAARAEMHDLISARLVHQMQRRASEMLDAPEDGAPSFTRNDKA